MAATIAVEDIADLIRKQLKKKLPADARLEADTELGPVGLSSLDVTEVLFGIEERVGFELDPNAVAHVKTIGDLVEVVNRLAEEQAPGGAADAQPAASYGA